MPRNSGTRAVSTGSQRTRTFIRHIRSAVTAGLLCTVFPAFLLIAGVVVQVGQANAIDPNQAPPPPPVNNPPVIAEFNGIAGSGIWVFQGQVIDENPLGMVITFGGVLNGHEVVVSDSDGYFYYGVELTGVGVVTALTVDELDQVSNLATCYLN